MDSGRGGRSLSLPSQNFLFGRDWGFSLWAETFAHWSDQVLNSEPFQRESAVGRWLSPLENVCIFDTFIFSLHCVILVLESALFGMFVSAILVDQFQAIFSDETAVEQVQHQGPFRPHKPKLALLTEVCGRGHPVFWLLPCVGVSRRLDEPLLNHEVWSIACCVKWLYAYDAYDILLSYRKFTERAQIPQSCLSLFM